MKFTKEFNSGLKAYGEAHRVIMEHKLTRYLIIPGIISVVYACLYFLLVWYWAGQIETEIKGTEAWLESWPDWLELLFGWAVRFFVSVSEGFLRVVFWAAMIWLFFATFKYVVQIFVSPMLSKLSEVIEHKLYGTAPPKIGFKEYVDDMVRALKISVRNLLHELILCLAAGWVPIIGGFLAFGISAYYYGFGYMDYTMERKRLSIQQSVRFVRKHRGLAVGIGFVCQLGMMIPILGWMIIPTYATAASTLEVLKIAYASQNNATN